ncbi:MAG: MBL fold metallo-hydrolase [Saprospiraceae bacterium]|nr:MBL fold metallo-hydrolase [Saprospiraceae bacterium]
MVRFLTTVFLLLPLLSQAQRNFDDVEIKIHPVTQDIYMLEGAGGNIGVLVGEDGVLIVDTQYGPLSEKITAAIRTLSDGEIRYVANTHFHGDHSGGNKNFANAGAQIIAHENVRKRMSEEQKRPYGPATPAAPESARPILTYTDEFGLIFNNQRIMMIHVDDAHTDGDAFVYFPETDVLHLGDTYFQGRYPYIDLHSGGSIDGMINAANTALFLAGKNTKIIPGHGALSNADELQEYRDVLMHLRREVAAGIAAGKSLEDIQKMKPGAETDAGWGAAFIGPERIIKIIYDSLTAKS